MTANWTSAVFVINVDGSGFHALSDGTYHHWYSYASWIIDKQALFIVGDNPAYGLSLSQLS